MDVARSGPEGLNFALVAEYNLLILNVMLPGMDGLRLLKELRKRAYTTPVLLLTACDSQIAEHIWNFDFVSDSNVIDVYIGYLRRKIDRGFSPPLIHTVRWVGYRLSAEVESD